MTVNRESEAVVGKLAAVDPEAAPAEREVRGVAQNVSAAGWKVLPAAGEIVPFFPNFVSVYHNVVPPAEFRDRRR
jgi:hypothetical protein